MLVAHLLWCNFQITIFESDVSGEFSEAFASGLFVGIDDSTTEKATSVVVSAKLIDKLVARTVIPDVTQQPCQYGSWMMSAVKAKRLEFELCAEDDEEHVLGKFWYHYQSSLVMQIDRGAIRYASLVVTICNSRYREVVSLLSPNLSMALGIIC